MPLDLPFPLRFPGYFEAPLFRTFFHFPWDFEIAGFDCTSNWLMNFHAPVRGRNPLYKTHRYMRRQRSWIFSRFSLEFDIDFNHLVLK